MNNKCRELLILAAKLYVEKHEGEYRVDIINNDTGVWAFFLPRDRGKRYEYPSNLVWNRHIVKAWAVAKSEGDSTLEKMFGEGAIQPKEVVEGMYVEVSDAVGDGGMITFVVPGVTHEYAQEINAGKETDFTFIKIDSDTWAVYE